MSERGVHVWVEVGCPPSTTNNVTIALKRLGGFTKVPEILFFESRTPVRFCKKWSFSGQLPHFSGLKLHPFLMDF